MQLSFMFLRCWSFEEKDCFGRLDDQFVRWNSSRSTTFDGCLSVEQLHVYYVVGLRRSMVQSVITYKQSPIA